MKTKAESEYESYSDGEGPICPCCGYEYLADEPEYFDEKGFEKECSACGVVLFIQPYNSTTWTTIIK